MLNERASPRRRSSVAPRRPADDEPTPPKLERRHSMMPRLERRPSVMKKPLQEEPPPPPPKVELPPSKLPVWRNDGHHNFSFDVYVPGWDNRSPFPSPTNSPRLKQTTDSPERPPRMLPGVQSSPRSSSDEPEPASPPVGLAASWPPSPRKTKIESPFSPNPESPRTGKLKKVLNRTRMIKKLTQVPQTLEMQASGMWPPEEVPRPVDHAARRFDDTHQMRKGRARLSLAKPNNFNPYVVYTRMRN